MCDPLRQVLLTGLNALYERGLERVNDEQISSLLTVVTLLKKWGRVYNLSAIRDPQDMITRHLLDSVLLGQWLPQETHSTNASVDVIDVGSGAGFPVLPLAILRPDLTFMSIEANGKKIRFQQQAILELGLANIQLCHQRVESLTQQAGWVVSRAFTAPEEFLRVAYPLCRPGGKVITMLGMANKFPLSVSPEYHLLELVDVTLPGSSYQRHVAICQRQQT